MLYHIIHNLSGIVIVISLFAKVALHIYLEKMNFNYFGIMSIIQNPFPYFVFYKNTVDNEYSLLKIVCNLSLKIGYSALILNVVSGLEFL